MLVFLAAGQFGPLSWNSYYVLNIKDFLGFQERGPNWPAAKKTKRSYRCSTGYREYIIFWHLFDTISTYNLNKNQL